MDLHTRPAQRREERQSLDVIHMQVGQQDVDPLEGGGQALPQGSDPGPRIEHDQRALFPLHGNTGGVSPVTGSIGARGSK